MSVSNRVTQSAGSAGASGSLSVPPAYIQVPEPPTIAPPSAPLELLTLALRVMLEQGPFEWKSAIQNNGRLEM